MIVMEILTGIRNTAAIPEIGMRNRLPLTLASNNSVGQHQQVTIIIITASNLITVLTKVTIVADVTSLTFVILQQLLHGRQC